MRFVLTTIFFFVFLLGSESVFAKLPDIGSNEFFKCIEVEEESFPGECYGDIYWIKDQQDKGRGIVVSFRKAKKLIKKHIRYFRKQERRSRKKGNEEEMESFAAKLEDMKLSKAQVKECFSYAAECSSTKNLEPDEEEVKTSTACEIIVNPSQAGPRKKITPMIVNGEKCSNLNKTPVLQVINGINGLCTGTYIGDGVVLTAAHCFSAEGACNGASVLKANNFKPANVVACTLHPEFNLEVFDTRHDLALVFLDRNLNSISKVAIRTSPVEVNEDILYAGYGKNEVNNLNELRATFNTVLDSYTEYFSSDYRPADNNDEGTFCFGDSGSGTFTYEAGEWKVSGLVSATTNDCALPDSGESEATAFNAALQSASNIQFIKDNTEGILD